MNGPNYVVKRRHREHTVYRTTKGPRNVSRWGKWERVVSSKSKGTAIAYAEAALRANPADQVQVFAQGWRVWPQ